MNLPEVNKIIDTFKKKYNYQNLTILNDLKEIQKYQYDFVYCGSTLQYLNDYNNFILNILPITKKNIMFAATHFFSDNDRFDHIVAKQLNFLPKLFYLYFFNLDSFSKKLKEYHFNIEFNRQNESHDIKYDSFKYLNLKNIKYTDILFSKN